MALLSARLLAATLAAAGLTAVAAAPLFAAPSEPAVLWRQAFRGWGEPAADRASAYVLTREHDLIAFDAQSGDVRWRAHTGGTSEVPLGSAVRLSTAFAIVGDDAIVAFDRTTGRLAWRFDPPGGHAPGLFLGDVDDDLVLAGSVTGRLYAIDTASGRLRWSRRLTWARASTVYPAIVAGGAVIASFTTFGESFRGGVAAFHRDGRRRWRHVLPRGSGAGGAPTLVDDAIVVARTDGPVDAIDLRDGRLRWTLPRATPRDPRQALARDIRPLAYAGGLLVVGSLTGELAAFDPRARREVWRYEAGPEGAAALRLRASASDVYAPFTDGSLVALCLDTGVERWRAGGAAAPLEWPPAIGGGRVFAAGDSVVTALSAAPDGGAAEDRSTTEQAPEER